MGITNQSFDPRVATAQMIFGIIYVMITLIALCLAFYVQAEKEPYLYYFMAVLFGLMAAKSFFICSRTKTLLKEGVYHVAKVDSVEPVRGITVVKGVCEVEGFGPIYIESRLVGETIAHELKKFMQDHKQDSLPALVVGMNSNKPRGMFSIKSKYGHLDDESAMLKSEAQVAAEASAQAESATPAHGSLDAEGNITLQSPEEIVANAVAQADAEIKAAQDNAQKANENDADADAAEQAQGEAQGEAQAESAAAATAEATAEAKAQPSESVLPEAGVDKKTDDAIMAALNKAENENNNVAKI